MIRPHYNFWTSCWLANPDEVLEDNDDELVDTKADLQDMDAGTAGFTNYMKE